MTMLTMIFDWLQPHTNVLWWLGALSGMTFIGTLIVIPLLVVRIPADYFTCAYQHAHAHHGALYYCALLVKNALGLLFILAGVAMLVLPGQGILTILIGIMLMNFPRKRALELRLVQQPTVLRALNWIRANAKQPALVVPDTPCRKSHLEETS